MRYAACEQCRLRRCVRHVIVELMPDYDTREALYLLKKGLDEKHASERAAEALASAEALLEGVIEAAKTAGLKTTKDKNGFLLAPSRVGSSRAIWVVAQADGIHLGIEQHGRTEEQLVRPKIVYDGGLGAWVGTEPDTFFVPVPGEPARRRPAAAVVAESIVAALAKFA
jgi:hypothetical protein